MFRLWSSENKIVGIGSRSGRINQSQCTFPRFVIGLVLLLLLPTPTIWFSLDHKLYASDYRPTPTPSLVKPAFRGLILIFRRVSPSLIFGSPLGNGCEEDQGIQDWFNLPVFVEYSQISKPTVKSNSHFVGVNIAILIFIKSVENISSLLDLERGQHSNKLKLQGIRITLKKRPVTYSNITAPEKKIAPAFHVPARPPNFPLPFPQGIGSLRSRASVSLFCVERHSGTVFGAELWPTFPRNVVLANKKATPRHLHSAIRHNIGPVSHAASKWPIRNFKNEKETGPS